MQTTTVQDKGRIGREIHPSEPVYFNSTNNGKVLFRSKLEARWAMFFDMIKERWHYEPHSFMLDDGIIYVPDFYLENIGWIEVKPSWATIAESINKINLFVQSKQRMPDKLKATFFIFSSPFPNFNDSMLMIKSPTLWYRGKGIGYDVLCKNEFARQTCFKNKTDWMIYIDRFLDYVAKHRFYERGWCTPEFPSMCDLRN